MLNIFTAVMAFTHYPIAIPTNPVSLLWALPVSLGIAAVYKAVKIEKFSWPLFAREVSLLFVTIISALILTAICLAILARFVGLV